MAWGKLVSLELDDEEKLDFCAPMPCERPDYPYGTRISLTEKELEKLGLDADCDVGDMVDMRCFGTVTSVSKNVDGDKQSCHVEIQIERMAIENEMEEET